MRRRSDKNKSAKAESEALPVEALRSVRMKMLCAEKQLNSVFVEREQAIRVMLIAHLIRQHYILIGTPGTAKTAVATCFTQHIEGGTYFKRMLGSFSTPDKVFGPLDIKRFNDGEYEHVIDGKLADVKYAFLDEFFKANEATLNELLEALNEREFNGARIPLQTCGMATNWPEVNSRTDNVNALYDRCLLRVPVADVESEAGMVKVLEAIDAVEAYVPEERAKFTDAELEAAQMAVAAVPLSKEVRKIMAGLRNTLRWRHVAGKKKDGILITSRRLGALQSALRASAWLRGSDSVKGAKAQLLEVTLADFDILRFGLWNDQADQEHLDAALKNLDKKLVDELLAKIDTARREYKSMSDNDFGTSRAVQVTEAFQEAVGEVKAVIDKPLFTATGKAKVDKGMKKLAKDFKEMGDRVSNFVEQNR